jgi:cell division protein ZapA
MKRPLDVEIMGQRLTVTSDDGDEHVQRMAEYVDQQMRQLAGRLNAASVMQVALLTALNIASEYWKLHEEQEELHRTIKRLSQRVLARLEG